MASWPELFILRHGQTEWNAEGRAQGQQNSDLTPKGRAQAHRQGEILQEAGLGPRGLPSFCSPQGRAQHTADIALDVIAQSARADDRLMEIGFGKWEGRTRAEIEQGWPWSQDIQDMMEWQFSAPLGESFDAVCARVSSFLDHLTGPTIVVTHGVTSRVMRGLWLGLEMPGMSDLPGGQGIVHHLKDGVARVLV